MLGEPAPEDTTRRRALCVGDGRERQTQRQKADRGCGGQGVFRRGGERSDGHELWVLYTTDESLLYP